MNNSAYTIKLDQPRGGQTTSIQSRSPTAGEAMSVDVVQPHLLPHLIQHSVGQHSMLTYSNVNKLLNKNPAANPQSLKRGSLPDNKIQRLHQLKEQLQYHRLIKQNIRSKNLHLPRQVWKKKNPLKFNDEVIGSATQDEIYSL